MLNIFKKLFGTRYDNQESNINLVNKTFILKQDYLNPFINYYVIVIAAQDGWVQYNYVFRDTGPSSGSPMSAKINVFFEAFTEINRPFWSN